MNSKFNAKYSNKRRVKLVLTQEEQASPLTGKYKKNDLLSRKEVCNLMLWSQSELTWHIRYAGFPSQGNRFSRSAIKQWVDCYDSIDGNEYARTYHYRMLNRRTL